MKISHLRQIRLLFTSVFALLTLISSARAQPAATLSGRVLDPDGGVVPGATVELHSRNSAAGQATNSDRSGAFEFRDVVPGGYLLQVGATGFALLTTTEITLAAGAHDALDVHLELARIQTEVIVTASTTPLMLEEVAKATDIVGLAEIDLRDEHSIAGSLRLIPGFRVRQTRGPGSFTSIQVRGLRSYDTALLIDGLRVRDAADTQGSASPLWESLMVVAPRQVEVLRGSGSSLYGSHAIGGVVNVVTDTGGGKPHGEFLVEGGGLGMVRSLGKVAGGALSGRLLYSGGLTHLNVTRGLDGVSPYRNTSSQGSLRYALAPGVHLGGRALFSDSFTRLADSPHVAAELMPNLPATGIVSGVPLPDDQVHRLEQGLPFEAGSATYVPSLNDPDYNRAGRFYNLATTFSHQLGHALSYRASYQYLDSSRRHDDGPAGVLFEPVVGSHSTFDGRVHILQGRADLQAGRHNLISGGYEFEDESYDNLNTDEHPDPAQRTMNRATVDQRSHSLFVQDQISLLDRSLTVSLSGRMQAFRLTEPEFGGGDSPYAGTPIESPKTAWTGDAAVAYLIRSTGTKWRAHLGNSYRAPSIYERFGASFFFGSFSPYGDPRLRPERAVSIDTGFDQYLAGSRVKLSATYFYTRLQETIIFDFSGLIPPDDPYRRFGGYLNVPGGLARGVELSVNAKPADSTTINASYTYSNSNRREPWDVDRLVTGELGVSHNMFSLLVLQRFGRRFNVAFDLVAADNYLQGIFASVGTRAYDMPGFVKADLTGRYVLPVGETTTVEFYGKFENLFNRKLYENGFRAPGFWAIGGMRFVF